jgi:CheY-like chemotaxis protein
MQLVTESARLPHLHSFQLLASALTGLLKQLSSKASYITPSALRTAASGIDLLEPLSTRAVRVDLVAHPDVRLLVVDDDPISRGAMSMALKKVFTEPDLAGDGESGLESATKKAYDVIFLDVEMPGLDGFEVCSKIHATELNRRTPIVFVTSHSDFDSRAKGALSGANDLIGKPFLAFEITVKALTLLLKGRLDSSESKQLDNKTEKPALTSTEPDQAPLANTNSPIQAAISVQADSASERVIKNSTDTKPRVEAFRGRPARRPIVAKSALAQPSRANTSLREPSVADFAHAFFEEAPEHVQSLRERLAMVREAPGDGRDELLAELFIGTHSICTEAGRAELKGAFRLGCALEAMLKKLVQQPSLCRPSALDTVAAGFSAIERLCQSRRDIDLTQKPVRLLVVDDDPIARRAVSVSLQLAFGRPDNAESGEAAVLMSSNEPYDLIFMDVLMPGMDGFATCGKIHERGANQKTPVIFVTSNDDLGARTQAEAVGGCGFIPKPVLPCEIMLIALAYIVASQLERRACESVTKENNLTQRNVIEAQRRSTSPVHKV